MKDGYHGHRSPEVRRPPTRPTYFLFRVRVSFAFEEKKIGVIRAAYNRNDNQRSPKTRSALPLDYGDSCTVMVIAELQYT